VSLIGIDLGGTKLASAIFTEDGAILHRDSIPLAGRGGNDVAALVVDQVRALIVRSPPARFAGTRAVGVAVPGIYRAATGTVWAPNIPGWDDYPLLEELRTNVGRETQVAVDSDRAAYILGETWHRGGAHGARDALFVAVGTGIGVGILADGRVLRGHAGVAGAAGWLALQRPYREDYAGCGCFEYHASGPGLVKVARELVEQDPSYAGELRRKALAGEITTADLFAAYEREDALATRVLDDAIELWGMGAANLVSLFDPETVVFGGGVFGPAVRFLDRIRTVATRWGQPISMQRVRFVASTLGGDAGLYGAGRLALMELTEQQ
jgi:glucokinase